MNAKNKYRLLFSFYIDSFNSRSINGEKYHSQLISLNIFLTTTINKVFIELNIISIFNTTKH